MTGITMIEMTEKFQILDTNITGSVAEYSFTFLDLRNYHRAMISLWRIEQRLGIDEPF